MIIAPEVYYVINNTVAAYILMAFGASYTVYAIIKIVRSIVIDRREAKVRRGELEKRKQEAVWEKWRQLPLSPQGKLLRQGRRI